MTEPVPAEKVEVWIASDGVELCERGTGRKLITIRHDQVNDFIGQLVDAQGAALLAHVHDVRSGQ